MSQSELVVDFCSYQAARYAVKHWHYSKSLSASKNVFLGVWESGVFIGAVVFGRGANNNLHKPFSLDMTECVELTRVALNKHDSQVSRILSIATGMLKRINPGVRLIVSYADPNEGHVGKIYQAANWVYTGTVKVTPKYLLAGRWVHARQADSMRGTVVGLDKKPMPDKHRYLYPLDRAMRRQIAPLAKPYPKREEKNYANVG